MVIFHLKETQYNFKDVTYTNLENMLKADLIEMDIKTKDTKISMYEQKKK